MSQTSIANYFHTRKRTATDDGLAGKTSKVRILDNNEPALGQLERTRSGKAKTLQRLVIDVPAETKATAPKRKIATKPRSTAKSKKTAKEVASSAAQSKPLVAFIRKGLLSPNHKKVATPIKPEEAPEPLPVTPRKDEGAVPEKSLEAARGMVTPVKQIVKSPKPSTSKAAVLQNMSLGEIKEKLNASSRMTELKSRLNALKQGFDKADRLEETRKAMVTPKKTMQLNREILGASPTIKKFDKMEVEIMR